MRGKNNDIGRRVSWPQTFFQVDQIQVHKLVTPCTLEHRRVANQSTSTGIQEPFPQIQGSAHLQALIAFSVIRDNVKATVRVVNRCYDTRESNSQFQGG